MKWSLEQLFKYLGKPFSFKGSYDFKDNIKVIDDILNISIFEVEGIGKCLYDDRYQFDLEIKGVLYLQDAWTLDEVQYPLNIKTIEIFDVKEDDDVNLIEKNTIDLKNVVWENIILNKPMRVTKKVD